MDKKTSGILLIATGHAYYGRMAFNIAMSIKAVDKDFPIALVHSGSSLNHISNRNMCVFDHLIALPPRFKSDFGAKLHLDELTPFEETLYLDVDMAWLPRNKPSELFEKLKDIEFTGITEGYYDIENPEKSAPAKHYYYWAEPTEIVEKYGLQKGRLYQWRSEVMYFKKTDRVQRMFQKAREVYADPGLNSMKLFAHHVPDELALNIACAIEGIEPHQFNWQPSYWNRMHGEYMPAIDELYGKYYLLSCGSNVSSGSLKKGYDRVVKAAAYKLGIQYNFPLISKRDFMKERQIM